MNILRKNTAPYFQIVPRVELDVNTIFRMELKNEFNQFKESIFCAVSLRENENYNVLLDTFPVGKISDKFSFTLFDENENVVLLGKLIIVSETENIQDYSKKSNNKFYS